MKLTMVIELNSTDDLDEDDIEDFKLSVQNTFEESFSANPLETHQTEDGDFEFEITSNVVSYE